MGWLMHGGPLAPLGLVFAAGMADLIWIQITAGWDAWRAARQASRNPGPGQQPGSSDDQPSQPG